MSFTQFIFLCSSVEEEINKAIEEPVDAQVHLKKAKDLIAGRQKLIKLADQSEHGWATVAEYETNELAADEDDEKRMQRAESRAGKKIKQKQNAKQSSKKRFKQGESRLDIFDPSGNKLFRGGVGSASSSSSSARGSCFFCGQFGHWKESCPARRRERFQAAKQVYVPPCIHLFPHARADTIQVLEQEHNFSKFDQLTIYFPGPIVLHIIK